MSTDIISANIKRAPLNKSTIIIKMFILKAFFLSIVQQRTTFSCIVHFLNCCHWKLLQFKDSVSEAMLTKHAITFVNCWNKSSRPQNDLTHRLSIEIFEASSMVELWSSTSWARKKLTDCETWCWCKTEKPPDIQHLSALT